MTTVENLENQIKEIKEKCKAQREIIERDFGNTYKDLLDLNKSKAIYLIHDISLLDFYEDRVVFAITFEDGDRAFLDITPNKIDLRIN